MIYEEEFVCGKSYKVKFNKDHPFNDADFFDLKERIHRMRNFDFEFIIIELDLNEYGLYFLQFIKMQRYGELDLFHVEVKILEDNPLACSEKGIGGDVMFGKEFEEGVLVDIIRNLLYDKKLPDFSTWENITFQCLGTGTDEEKHKEVLGKRARRIMSEYWSGKFDDCRGAEFLFYSACKKTSNWTNELYLAEKYRRCKKYKKILEMYKKFLSIRYLQRLVADIAFYGYLGQRDLQKAYEMYLCAAKCGNFAAAYKLGLMYKNGIYVKKDFSMYKRIMIDIYNYAESKDKTLYYKLPDILLEMSYIESEDLKKSLAFVLTVEDVMKYCVEYSHDDEFLKLFERIKERKYELTDFDNGDADIFDLLYLLKTPGKTALTLKGKEISAESFYEDGALKVEYLGEKYNGILSFFKKAKFNGKALYLYGI